jgi:hypothetical protein
MSSISNVDFVFCSCGTQGQTCCPYGWSASRGWDAMTGLGTFNNVVNNGVLFPAN